MKQAIDRRDLRSTKQVMYKDGIAIKYKVFNESLSDSLFELYFWFNGSDLSFGTLKVMHAVVKKMVHYWPEF